jgi:hypothetical protein
MVHVLVRVREVAPRAQCVPHHAGSNKFCTMISPDGAEFYSLVCDGPDPFSQRAPASTFTDNTLTPSSYAYDTPSSAVVPVSLSVTVPGTTP